MFEPLYCAQAGMINEDYLTEKEARDRIEGIGYGCVVKFGRRRNNHGCLPEIVHYSISMDVWRNGEWKPCNIHG